MNQQKEKDIAPVLENTEQYCINELRVLGLDPLDNPMANVVLVKQMRRLTRIAQIKKQE